MDDGFTLHGSPHSLPTYRIALMMRLCRTSFTFRCVSFQRGMHQTPEFRALSRWGQVPVLEHDAGFSCNRRQSWNTLWKRSANSAQPISKAVSISGNGCFGMPTG